MNENKLFQIESQAIYGLHSAHLTWGVVRPATGGGGGADGEKIGACMYTFLKYCFESRSFIWCHRGKTFIKIKETQVKMKACINE
jgi:hypothetical protein